MNWLRAVFVRLGGLFGRERRDRELAAELESHLAMHVEENVRAGMGREEARRQALLKLGGVEQTKENVRDRRGLPWVETLLQDIRFGLRMLRKNPGFTAVAVLTLALGIGANTAIFSVVDAVLLRPVPFKNAFRLTLLGEGFPKAGLPPAGFSAPDLMIFEHNQKSFEAIGAYRNKEFGLSGDGEPERVMAARVSASVFPMLGATPVLGRWFTPQEDSPGHNVAILSYGLWQARYGADRGILGRAIALDRVPYTVVGVMPKGFEFPMPGPAINPVPAQLWVPMAFTPLELQGWGMMYNNSVLGTLRPGVSLAQGRAGAQTIGPAIQAEYPASLMKAFSGSPVDIWVDPFHEQVVGQVKTLLVVLIGAVSLVLLIACANVATLLVSRSNSRQKEVAMRAALGATRIRLVRQMLTESLLLAIFGGALGFALALLGKQLLLSLVPRTISLAQNIPIGGGVLVYLMAISCATAMLFGVAPAFQVSSVRVQSALQEGGRGGSSGRGRRRLQAFFVTTEFALALVLLIGAGLLIRSLRKLVETNPGFRPDHVLTLSVPLPFAAYPKAAEIRQFYGQLLERLGGLPGVKAAGISNDLPLFVSDMEADAVDVQGNQGGSAPTALADQTWVSANYFQTVGIPLIEGRWFTPEDRRGSQPVAIVSQGMARRFWPGKDPVGQRIGWGPPPAPWLTIVGIAGDVNDRPLSGPAQVHVYLPYAQLPDQLVEDNVMGMWRSMNVVVLTHEDPASMASALVGQIRALDPDLAVSEIRAMTDLVHSSVAGAAFATYLFAAFAGVALFLASIGIYGVLSYTVSQQTHDIGVRMALGAKPLDVLALILRQGVVLAGLGAAVGVAAAVALTRLMAGLLYGVEPTDPVTFAAVVVVLLGVALIACWIPARRAMRVDPIVALRYE